jgi:hypothetical protein
METLTETVPELTLDYLNGEIQRHVITARLTQEYPTKGWEILPFGRHQLKNSGIQKSLEDDKGMDFSFREKSSLVDHLWLSHISNHYNKPKGYWILTNYYTQLLGCQYQVMVADTSCTSQLSGTTWIGKISPWTEDSTPLRKYVDELVVKDIVSSEIRDTAWRIWESLQNVFTNKLPEPDAASGANNNLMLAFDDGLYHLEFEINQKDHFEVFFLQRDTNYIWEKEFTVDFSLPNALLEKVSIFLK